MVFLCSSPLLLCRALFQKKCLTDSAIFVFYIHGLKRFQSTKCVIIDVAHHLKRFHCFCNRSLLRNVVSVTVLWWLCVALTLVSKWTETFLFIWLVDKDHELTVFLRKGPEPLAGVLHLPIMWDALIYLIFLCVCWPQTCWIMNKKVTRCCCLAQQHSSDTKTWPVKQKVIQQNFISLCGYCWTHIWWKT